MTITLIILLSLLSLSLHAQEDNSQFLFNHPKLCGDPFADPMWIPVLDLCSIKCNPLKEYCVENDDLKQMCKPLPEDCQTAFREYLSRKWTRGEGNGGLRRRFSKRLI